MKQFRDTPYYVTENGEVYRLWKTGFKKMKPSINPDGYYLINFCHNGKKKSYRVNRLVAECYLPNPNNLPLVEHKDDVKTNNNVSNLMWSTIADNNKHAWNNKLIKPKKGEHHYNSKLSNHDIIWIKQNYIKGDKTFGCVGLSKKFNVSFSQISNIVNNKHWKHVTPQQSSEYE